MRFFVVYRSPNGVGSDGNGADVFENMRLLIACLKQYTAVVDTSIIVGDFNLPKVNWQTTSSYSDGVSKLFLNFISTRSFYQFVAFPTREENILDLIFANDEQIVNSVLSKPPLGHSVL